MQKRMDKIAVLIPCYNEAKTIRKVVQDFRAVLPDAKIYVYDNNSTDGTDRIAEEVGAIVRYEYQQGKGSVIRRMLREIDAECYLMVDGDDTYPADSAREMTDLVLKRQADMVIGDRLSATYYQENKRLFHNFGNSLVRNSINVLFDNDIKDIMTGYRAFNYEFAKTYPVLSRGFEIETEMSIHAADKRMRVEHVMVDYRDRPEGSISKLNTYSDGVKVLKTIAKLYVHYNPGKSFGMLALVLALLSAVFFCPVLKTYLESGLVPNFPTLIVCGFTMIAAIQSLFCGLVLQNIVLKNRRDFELHLLQVNSEKKRILSEEGGNYHE